MPGLNDDCWLLIFELLDLNERTNVRLTCKRFRALCDVMKIHKLVIYHRRAPSPGRLERTNEPYGLEHTAYVVNLCRFFDNEQILKQMRPIRALIIHGDYLTADLSTTAIDLKVKFEQLNYLELHHCAFISPTLLSSSKLLEFLILDRAFFRPAELIRAKQKKIVESKSDDCWFWYSLGLEELESRRLKYFSVNDLIDAKVPKKAIDSHLFDCLEEADLCLPHWQFNEPLVRKEHCPMLKRLNVMIGSGEVHQVVDSVGQTDLSELFSSFSEQLTVHLLGFPFNQQQKSAMVEFFKPFGLKIQLSRRRFYVRLDQQIYQHIKKWHKKVNLSQFYQMVDRLLVTDGSDQLNSDREFFRRFSRCNCIDYQASPRLAHLDRHLDGLTNLKSVLLFCAFDHPSTVNKLLKAIGKKCKQLELFGFDSVEKIDFGVLFRLQRLKAIKMRLAFFPQCTLIDLLKNHRNLADLDVCFIRSNGESKAELSDFKKRLNETFSERFKARKLEFRVQIYTNVGQFVRYQLHGVNGSTEIPESCKEAMFVLIKRLNQAQESSAGSGVQEAVWSVS